MRSAFLTSHSQQKTTHRWRGFLTSHSHKKPPTAGEVLRCTHPNAICIPNLTFAAKNHPPLARFCGVLTQMRSAFLTSHSHKKPPTAGEVLRCTHPNAICIPNLAFAARNHPPLARFCGVLTQMRSAFLTSHSQQETTHRWRGFLTSPKKLSKKLFHFILTTPIRIIACCLYYSLSHRVLITITDHIIQCRRISYPPVPIFTLPESPTLR